MIGVFDSGYGGLVILKELIKVLPEYSYLYLGDNARAPYGQRSAEEIYKFTLEGVEKLFAEGSELVILACNTASANALRRIQQNDLQRYPGKNVLGILVPTVEQITGVAWTATHSSDHELRVAVFGTPATVQSGAYEKEIKHRVPKAEVISIACADLVPLIESGASDDQLRASVKQYVSELSGEVDVALLGCTHYPLIKHLFVEALPNIPIFDQGTITAESLKSYILRHKELELKRDSLSSRRFLTTGNPNIVGPLASKFFGSTIVFEKVVLS